MAESLALSTLSPGCGKCWLQRDRGWDFILLGLSAYVPMAVQSWEPLSHPEHVLGEAFVFQPRLPYFLGLTHTPEMLVPMSLIEPETLVPISSNN